MPTTGLLLPAAIAALTLAAPAAETDWPQWRGPAFNGSSPAEGLPHPIGPQQNVLWQAPLPGTGASTPIVRGERIYITAQDASRQTWALCFDRATGRERWKQPVGSGFSNGQGNTAASPSPVADAAAAYFLFGNGDFAAFDPDGRQLWKRNLQQDHGKFSYAWDYGGSPLLHAGRLYVSVIHAGTSYLLAVDPQTGADVWKHPRSGPAQGEALQAYTTPLPWEGSGGPAVLALGADVVTAHDPASGRERWRSTSYNSRGNKGWRICPSPVVANDLIAVATPRAGQVLALKPNGQAQLDASAWVWTADQTGSDVPTPALHGGRLFVLNGGRRSLACLDPRTGAVLGQADLGPRGVFESSPTAADGRIYTISLGGELVICSAEDTPRVLHRAAFGGRKVRASIVPAGRNIFLRTEETLYCFGR